MTDDNHAQTLQEIFEAIQYGLPGGWLDLREDLRLHHLLKAVNGVLKPIGNWILVDGDLTLLDLLSQQARPTA